MAIRMRHHWLLFVILVALLCATILNVFIFAIVRLPHDLGRLHHRKTLGLLPKAGSQFAFRARSETGSRPRPPLQLVQQQLSFLPAVPGCGNADASCEVFGRPECMSNPAFMMGNCKELCGLCQLPYLPEVPKMVQIAPGVSMPLVGFGTAGMGPATQQPVEWALQAGYRLIDSAQAREWYREDLVGAAIRAEGLPRASLFLTSKLHPRDHGFNSALRKLNESLADLGSEYLDLMLLHYPSCWGSLCSTKPVGTWQDSWRALEQAVRAGQLRTIGASNFNIGELAELLKFARIKPAVVQHNSDPFSQAVEVQTFCRLNGIQFQAYSSLGSQWTMKGHRPNPVLFNSIIARIAAEVNRTAAQVVLRWALQSGQAVIPMSSNTIHIQSNLQLFDFQLTPEMMMRINVLDGSLT